MIRAKGRWRIVLGYSALGAAMAAGQAPLGAFWITLPALAVLFAVLPQSADARAWGGRLWLAGTGYFAASLFWIIEPFLIEPEIHGWMAPFALVLMAGGMALFWALAGWGAALMAQGRTRLLGLGALLLALELVRGHLFGGFPWAMLGHVLIDTPLRAVAAFGGAGALSFLVVAPTMLVALPQPRQSRFLAIIGSGAALAALWVWGSLETALPPDRTQIVRLAQPNAVQSEKWQADNAITHFRRLLGQTAAPAQTPPALVIWPETAVPFLLEDPGEGLILMADALAAHGPDTQLAFGVQRGISGKYYNSLAVLDSRAQVTATYDKHHLVPFGEYIPLAEWLSGTPVAGLAGQALLGYSPGPGPQVLNMGDLGRVLPLICYESIFPRHARTTPRADWILQITNDGWFGELTGPYQHLAQARLRAMETGLPVIRVANTGVSAVIDARGGVVAYLPLGAQAYLDAAIPGALPQTLYTQWGDVPLWIALVLVLGAVLIRRSAR
jgi:apolipoprotein N-acyltransferase